MCREAQAQTRIMLQNMIIVNMNVEPPARDGWEALRWCPISPIEPIDPITAHSAH